MVDAIPQHVHCNVTASLFVYLSDSMRYAKMASDNRKLLDAYEEHNQKAAKADDTTRWEVYGDDIMNPCKLDLKWSFFMIHRNMKFAKQALNDIRSTKAMVLKGMSYQLWSENNWDRLNKMIKKIIKTDIYAMCHKRVEDIESLSKKISLITIEISKKLASISYLKQEEQDKIKSLEIQALRRLDLHNGPTSDILRPFPEILKTKIKGSSNDVPNGYKTIHSCTVQLRRTEGKIKNRPVSFSNNEKLAHREPKEGLGKETYNGNPFENQHLANGNPFEDVPNSNTNPFLCSGSGSIHADDNSLGNSDEGFIPGNITDNGTVEDSEKCYQYLCVEERVIGNREDTPSDEHAERIESPLPEYDVKSLAKRVRTAGKLVKRNLRDYVVAVTGNYDAEQEDLKYQRRKEKKHRRALAKKEFRAAMQDDDDTDPKSRRTLADKLNPFKKGRGLADKDAPSQGALIFDKDKPDRKQAYASKLQRYKDTKHKELESRSKCTVKAEPELEYGYKLKMVTYTPEQAANMKSAHWNVTSYADNIITLVNADDSLPCRTLAIVGGYKDGVEQNYCDLIEEEPKDETPESRALLVTSTIERTKQEKDRVNVPGKELLEMDAEGRKIKLKEKMSLTKKAIKNKIIKHVESKKIKKMVKEQFQEPLHVQDWSMSFRVAKCGEHFVLQSLQDKQFYLSCLQSGAVKSRLRSERVTRFQLQRANTTQYPNTSRKWNTK